MNQNIKEEGETRLGCFSDPTDNFYGIEVPECPRCNSKDYQLVDDKTRKKTGKNCRCCNCGFMFKYDFNV